MMLEEASVWVFGSFVGLNVFCYPLVQSKGKRRSASHTPVPAHVWIFWLLQRVYERIGSQRRPD